MWANIGLLLATLAVCLVALEGGLRVFQPYALTAKFLLPPGIEREFSTREFSTRVTTDGLGFRTHGEAPGEPGRRYRIAAVGDSFVFGWGVDDDKTVPARLQRRLNAASATPVEVINAGRPGDGLANYVGTLHRHVLRLSPDMVVLGFLPGNDCPVEAPIQLRKPELVTKRTGQLIEQAEGPQKEVRSYVSRLVTTRVLEPVRRWARPTFKIGEAAFGIVSDPITGAGNPLNPKSLDKRLAGNAVLKARYERLAADGWVEQGRKWEISPWLVHHALFAPEHTAQALFLEPKSRKAMEGQWNICAGLIRHLAAKVRAAGADFYLLVFPLSYQADKAVLAVREKLGIIVPERALTATVVNDRVRQLCETANLKCVDTLEAARRAVSSGRQIFFPVDGHLTEHGTDLVAAAAAHHIQEDL